MPDMPNRAAGSAWRVLAAAGACALTLAAVIDATGGVDWALGPLRIRAHSPWRLLGAGVGMSGAALWWGGARMRSAMARAWEKPDRYASWIAAAAAMAVAAFGLSKGTWTAGGADAYGYVSQALLWLKGLPLQPEPLAAVVPWPLAELTLAPLGYQPGVEPGLIVPTYPPGLPLTMAAFAQVGGTGAAYWVVPVLGAAAVWFTYLLGRRCANAASGAAAALLLAASPVFLHQLVQPMSDVPVTAWWLLSLWGAAAGLPAVAGIGAAAAVLTRPNLAPVVALVMAAVLAHAYSRHRGPRAVLRTAAIFAVPLAAGFAFLAWLNARLYGSPFVSGYGSAANLFSLGNVPVNAVRYPGWLLETQTPIVLIGLAAPFAAWLERRTDHRAPSSIPGWIGLAFAAVVIACYLPYSPFDEWWYLRFLLPAIPVLLLLTTPLLVRMAALAPAAARGPLLAAGVALLGWHYLATATERLVFDLRRIEQRYLAAGAFAARGLPAKAVLLSMQESGSLRLYGGRATVRFDRLDPRWLDEAVRFLDRAGYRPYFALEAWEEPQFRERFAPSSPLGLLDWPPMADVGASVRVRFYDPRDRERFVAGERVATMRDPGAAR